MARITLNFVRVINHNFGVYGAQSNQTVPKSDYSSPGGNTGEAIQAKVIVNSGTIGIRLIDSTAGWAAITGNNTIINADYQNSVPTDYDVGCGPKEPA